MLVGNCLGIHSELRIIFLSCRRNNKKKKKKKITSYLTQTGASASYGCSNGAFHCFIYRFNSWDMT